MNASRLQTPTAHTPRPLLLPLIRPHHLIFGAIAVATLTAIIVSGNTPSPALAHIKSTLPTQYEAMPPQPPLLAATVASNIATITIDLNQPDPPPAHHTVPRPLAIPPHTAATVAIAGPRPWLVSRVRRGDTLSKLFQKNNFEQKIAYEIVKLAEAAPLLKIHAGEEIRFQKTVTGEFAALEYSLDVFQILRVTADATGLAVSHQTRTPEVRHNQYKGEIKYSLIEATKPFDIARKTIYDFIALFGWQVDFSLDIRAGDQFALIYEELYLDDKKVGEGAIVAAELVVSGETLRAIRFVNTAGEAEYFAPDGSGIKGSFLRSPMEFAYITSNFSRNRYHPILKVWRSHKGVDYGAPRGTPVRATGNGIIKFAGRDRGYGKMVIIKHGEKYQTVYAHLNGYASGIKSGARVQQGDFIGYVGSTGLATGPHLHYEFRSNGTHKNPVTVKLPKSAPIAAAHLAEFKQNAGPWQDQLNTLEMTPQRITVAAK